MWHKVTNKFNVIAIICDNFTIQNLSQKKKKNTIQNDVFNNQCDYTRNLNPKKIKKLKQEK